MALIDGPGKPGRGGNGSKITEIKVRLPEQIALGVYANGMLVHHTANEFIMDFSMVIGNGGTVVSRVVTNPCHMKRMVAAMEDSLKRYEAVNGPIMMPESQPPMKLGFQPPPGGEN